MLSNVTDTYRMHFAIGTLEIEDCKSILQSIYCILSTLPTQIWRIWILDEEISHYLECKHDVNYVHKLHLKTLLFTKNKKPIQCFIDNTLIDQLTPWLHTIKYEEYMQQKSNFLFTLREIFIEGTFTLTQANAIMHVNLLQTTQMGQKVS